MTTDRTTQTFSIPEQNLDGLNDKLTRLARRAERLGVPAPEWTVGTRHETPVKDEITGFTRFVRVTYDVTLTSQPVQLAGWTFLGTLDHTTEAGVIVRAVPGVELDTKYRAAQPLCDHCGFNRRRNETFIVRHDDGREKQVGRQCVADFLGQDPKRVMANAEFLALAREAAEDAEERGGSYSYSMSLADYLAWVVLAIEKGGWVSRAAERENPLKCSTSSAAYDLREDFLKGKSNEQPGPERYAEAEAALAWVRGVRDSGQELNDYMHNLTTVCASEALKGKNMGIAASLIPAYRRETEREVLRKRQAATSQHVGTIGKRQVFEVTVAGVSQFDGIYGTRSLVRMLDAAGNILIWWTNSAPSQVFGEWAGRSFTVKATVKGHGDYKGTAQTEVQRLTVIGEDGKLFGKAVA